MRRARRWAWVLRGPVDLLPSDGILMGFPANVPPKRSCMPKVSVRARAHERGPVREVGGSLGSSPPRGVIHGIPSVYNPVLRLARGSVQVLAPSDQGLRPLRRCDPLYVRSEPIPQFVGFLSMFFFLSCLGFMGRCLAVCCCLYGTCTCLSCGCSSLVKIFDSR